MVFTFCVSRWLFWVGLPVPKPPAWFGTPELPPPPLGTDLVPVFCGGGFSVKPRLA